MYYKQLIQIDQNLNKISQRFLGDLTSAIPSIALTYVRFLARFLYEFTKISTVLLHRLTPIQSVSPIKDVLTGTLPFELTPRWMVFVKFLNRH